MTIKAKKSKINLREKLAELLNFRQIRDRLDGLGLYIGKDRTGTAENVAVRGGANIDDLQLAEISAALGDTAVDVFVYDTRNDSDGGKWRERTQHTSWYNEELNTATRGGRREFPAVAVIVAESNKVTIYDGDDPDLSMWMVFNASGGRMIWATQLSCVSSLNARLSIGSPASGFRYIDFVSDKMREWRTSGVNSISGDISERNSGNLTLIDIPGQDVIVNQIINDVAMTVLPNAPIDTETGLPVPTIAVATDGGVSVIKDDGSTVVDISGGVMKKVSFDSNNQLHLGRKDSNIYYYAAIPSGDIAEGTWRAQSDVLYVGNIVSGADIQIGDNDIVDVVPGVIGLDDDEDNSLVRLDINKNSLSDSMINFTNSRYNTGWMPGDIKLATLSDTTVETIGVNSDELLAGNNSTFDGGLGDWDDISIGSGVAVHNTEGGYVELARADASNNARIGIGLNLRAGQMYFLKFSLVGSSTSGVQVRAYKSSDKSFSVNLMINATASQDGTYTVYFSAEDGYDGIMFIPISGDSTVANLDNVSVRAITELITNGDFSNGTMGWNGLSGGVLSIDNGRLKIEETTNALDAYAVNSSVISTVVGQRYLLTWQFIKGTNTGFSVRFGNSGDQSYNYKSNIVGEYTDDGYYSFEFIATGTELNLSFIVNEANTYGFLDNVSVRPAEEDRSVNNNGLQIVGEINKTPVAPGADLVAYSGFSINNYLVQPYNEDLNFGTGDFSIMGWVNQPAGQTSYLLDRRSGANDGISMGINSDNLLSVSVRDGTSDSLGGVNFPTDSWAFVSFVRRDGIGYIYVNGTLLSQGNLDDDASENTPLVLGGISYTNIGYCAASLVLFRISATAPTDAQIAKIYRDEKALFQDGAQATLYGSSDAVTALAYDEKTELLHVGTSSGRSDFSGLRRINNTTTAVTTSISASNNLIAEQ